MRGQSDTFQIPIGTTQTTHKVKRTNKEIRANVGGILILVGLVVVIGTNQLVLNASLRILGIGMTLNCS